MRLYREIAFTNSDDALITIMFPEWVHFTMKNVNCSCINPQKEYL